MFPLCRGMFLGAPVKSSGRVYVPPMQGDVPFTETVEYGSQKCSPYAGGCSANGDKKQLIRLMFPLCRGMFRIGGCRSTRFLKCSPYAGGCSWLVQHHICCYFMFPLCRGMFRPRLGGATATERCPPSLCREVFHYR